MLSTSARLAIEGGWDIRASQSPRTASDGLRLEPTEEDSQLQMLSKEALRDLALMGSIIDLDAGEILFLEQQPLHAVYIVVAGDVRLSLQDVNGKRMTVHIAKRGSVLGMSEALSGSSPEWSAEILYAARIISIKRGDFLHFAECHPEIHRIAVAELIRTIRYTSRALRIVGLAYSAGKRLASQLLAWGEQGQRMGDLTRYHLALTHTQIAEFVGTSRETVSRAFAGFKRRGLVEIRGSILIIPSTTALRRYAERNESSTRGRRLSSHQGPCSKPSGTHF